MVTHVGVLGAGAIGAFVGARLCSANAAQTDFRVTLVGRQTLLTDVRGANDVVRTVTLDGKPGTCQCGAVGAPGLAVTDDVSALHDADVVLIAVKSAHTADAAAQLAAVLPRDGTRSCTVVSLQNGVRNAQAISAALGEGTPHVVLPGMVGFNVVWRDGAVFAQSTGGEIYMQRGGAAEALARLLNRGGIKTILQNDVTAIQHGKLLVNLNNAANALYGRPVLAMLRDGAARRAVALCMTEAIDVFTRAGIPLQAPRATVHTLPRLLSLPDCIFRLVQPLLIKIDPGAKASMLQDVEKGRPTEIEYLNGEVLRVARERGFKEPPVNAKMVALVKEVEAAGKGSPMMDGAEILKALRDAAPS